MFHVTTDSTDSVRVVFSDFEKKSTLKFFENISDRIAILVPKKIIRTEMTFQFLWFIKKNQQLIDFLYNFHMHFSCEKKKSITIRHELYILEGSWYKRGGFPPTNYII